MNSDEKRGVERFRRVKEEEINVDERLQDNSFEAKVSVLFYKKITKSDRKEKEKEKKNIYIDNIALQQGHSLCFPFYYWIVV